MSEKERNKGTISRRKFLKGAGLVFGGATVSSIPLLSACNAKETEVTTKTVTASPVTSTTTVTAPAVSTSAAPITKFIEVTSTVRIIEVNVNGYKTTVQVEPSETLAEMLREKLNLTGTKIGCDRGTCGACVVHLNGKPVLSCMMLAIEANGMSVTTIEGLATGGKLHPLQQAVYDNTGYQCGFCTSGLIMEAKALLEENSKPTVDEIKAALGGHICRCGSFYSFINSVMSVGGK